MSLQDDQRQRNPSGALPAAPPSGAAPRRPRRRLDLLLAWAVISGPAVALLLTLAARQRVGDLEARLVRDTNELFARTYPRPVHVDAASPGALGDAIARHLPPIEAVAAELGRTKEATERIRDVVSGEAPLAALPASVTSALSRLEPDLDALLLATRAERADFPATKDSAGPLDEGGWAGWQLAAKLAGLRMRRALAAGDPRGALRDGLDALALGRDAAIARCLIGRMVGASIVSALLPPVSDAVGALPDAGARRDALRRLRAIRDAFPPFSRTLADEATYTYLYVGEAFSDRARSALDPRARAVMRDGLRDMAWWQRLAVRDGWRDIRAAQDALVAAADLPDGDRSAAFAAVNARVMRAVNPFAAMGLPRYEGYARRADASNRRLDALLLAAAAGAFHDERRRWPASVEEIAANGDLLPSEATRLAEATLQPEDRGRALSLRLPLPRDGEKDPPELVIVLRGRRSGRR